MKRYINYFIEFNCNMKHYEAIIPVKRYNVTSLLGGLHVPVLDHNLLHLTQMYYSACCVIISPSHLFTVLLLLLLSLDTISQHSALPLRFFSCPLPFFKGLPPVPLPASSFLCAVTWQLGYPSI